MIVIPTPTHLMNDSVTITNRVISQENSGAWESSTSTTSGAISAFVQPVSSSDNLQYGRDEQTRLVRVFMDVLDVNGTAYSIAAGDAVKVNDTTGYRVVEADTDLCNIGCLRRAVLEYVA